MADPHDEHDAESDEVGDVPDAELEDVDGGLPPGFQHGDPSGTPGWDPNNPMPWFPI
ncbi:MAG TPA: hypothetical protein VHC45_01780 [Gaiellaceae bacterium]|jgi:hypothetical protein|nr:hypothetical protein [Gaiellaceae bacterium]